MKFKELRTLHISINKTKGRGHWKSYNKDFSDIRISVSHNTKDLDSMERLSNWMLYYFLGEYLCSCIFRGNRIKKECTDRKHVKPHVIGCIPFYIADRMLRRLWNLKIRKRHKSQKRMTEFMS